ncbi:MULTISPECIES: response regulator transcription factor [Burkholderia]|uniref:response regulator transcription factor n=1 Tax=Burkholderia TaxID=32008 RepID=UPI00084CA420|nr:MULTISPECIES: response regulator transcription factor [Burkholderia]MBR8207528.1 response regulator transcription factor [Burkholderia cenocepacia]MBR8235278.1 response regulator transcription factor [Burkholderia sp. AU32357]MBY4873822.1 response regulator transcription factor [Burkholderia sp. AU42008]OED13040.1 two-component system response regulator [Burkholderia sp. A2]OXI39932.1 DNA-binding response regulator [Burkholderia sp. AU17457]
MPRVAIVEDHERLAGLLSQALAAAGIESDRFGNTREAAYGIDRADYALLIVDRGLPDGDGLTFLRTLRAAGRMMPCLMLTARDALHDRIDGLESGADDYVTKPFEMSELVARVRTLMRRPALLTTLVASFADVTVDPPQRAMRCGDRTVLLAPAELQVMLCLIEAAGRTVRHAVLEHAAWGFAEAVTPNALEVTVHRLRKKLTAIGATMRLTNIRGAGFALRDA